jgi:Tfp pilus assembly protein FimT
MSYLLILSFSQIIDSQMDIITSLVIIIIIIIFIVIMVLQFLEDREQTRNQVDQLANQLRQTQTQVLQLQQNAHKTQTQVLQLRQNAHKTQTQVDQQQQRPQQQRPQQRPQQQQPQQRPQQQPQQPQQQVPTLQGVLDRTPAIAANTADTLQITLLNEKLKARRYFLMTNSECVLCRPNDVALLPLRGRPHVDRPTILMQDVKGHWHKIQFPDNEQLPHNEQLPQNVIDISNSELFKILLALTQPS